MINDYQNILDNLKKSKQRNKNDHVLLIDSLNMFIRGFSMLKAINPKGQHIGGLIGFLRSLGYVSRIIDPTRIILVFDGKGSSINRRNENPEYKSNRDNIKVTNWGMFDSREEERESMALQMSRLFDYLECLPVHIISLDKVEADDIISYLGQEFSKRNSKVTIVSSDKDFLQIIDKNVDIYAPVKKQHITIDNIKEHIGTLPENYIIIKSLSGDNSDNLRGVKGIGPKTLFKLFPDLLIKPVTIQEIYNIAEKKLTEKKLYAQIIYEWDLVESNYRLMNLATSRLSEEEKIHIIQALQKPLPVLRSGTFLHYLDQDSIEGITKNTESWLQTFSSLTVYNKN